MSKTEDLYREIINTINQYDSKLKKSLLIAPANYEDWLRDSFPRIVTTDRTFTQGEEAIYEFERYLKDNSLNIIEYEYLEKNSELIPDVINSLFKAGVLHKKNNLIVSPVELGVGSGFEFIKQGHFKFYLYDINWKYLKKKKIPKMVDVAAELFDMVLTESGDLIYKDNEVKFQVSGQKGQFALLKALMILQKRQNDSNMQISEFLVVKEMQKYSNTDLDFISLVNDINKKLSKNKFPYKISHPQKAFIIKPSDQK
ncbi:hypothetical protein JW796_01635 [Candidatus Dojkabacteria bacterium]|nr:hypothetical protein [Candidatus Dojkabacteria bacterium]